MKAIWKSPYGRDETAVLAEYAKFLLPFRADELDHAFDQLAASYKGRSWPTIQEIREAVGKRPAAHKDLKSFEEIVEARWAEARRIYAEMSNPQRNSAILEGFEPDYRRDATQVIYDRLRNGQEAQQLPVLSDKSFEWLRQRARSYQQAADWRKSEEGQKFLSKLTARR